MSPSRTVEDVGDQQRSAWPESIAHGAKRRGRVHVVQRVERRDAVDRVGFDWQRRHVADDEPDARAVP
jgi:hypothetical protein